MASLFGERQSAPITLRHPQHFLSIFPFIATASALGEIPLELWLLIKGVKAQRWREQAAAAAL